MGCGNDDYHSVNQHAISYVCLFVKCCDYKLICFLSSTRLGSSLSPNGLHISAAKRGGYDVYSLGSGVVLHTFVHGLTLDGDICPSTFLPRGFAFCGATVDGTVTLWDIKVGDRLQAVQHLCASMPPMILCIDTYFPPAGATLCAVAVCFTVTTHPCSSPLSCMSSFVFS